ncbi:MAG: response regulator transcription factor [Deltaproteobacteria bacterium]|nr:response regulator transcription factor [Deltaproteobacteria bacterium]
MGALKKVLIVDDYEDSCNMFKEILCDNYECLTTQDSTKTFELIDSYKPNLVLLDYRMPGLQGIDICQRIRSTEELKYIPVIFVSGVATVDEKIKAFEMGADDFVSKPFHVKELILRIKRLLERENEPHSEFMVSNLKMNLITRRVYVDDHEVQLTPKQFDILKLLVESKNNLVSRERFLNEIWGDTEVTSRNVDSQINYLKRKIEHFKGKISAVPSQGYRLDIS